MKSRVLIFLAIFFLCSCSINYTRSKFYVTNSSYKTIHFKASVLKYTSMGPNIITVPFSVAPNDTILARNVSLHKNALPNAWFTKFSIFPVDSVNTNDPNQPDNWVKSLDENGRAIYIFNLSE